MTHYCRTMVGATDNSGTCCVRIMACDDPARTPLPGHHNTSGTPHHCARTPVLLPTLTIRERDRKLDYRSSHLTAHVTPRIMNVTIVQNIVQIVASFVQINPPCNLCKTDPLSASELSGKVEDALAGRSPLFSSLLHRLYKMARSGFSLCKKNTKHSG